MSQRFFSFVIPAYNEELIIEKTIQCLDRLDYPKDRYEVIVIENGSTDKTYEKAKLQESGNVQVCDNLPKGVSRARNFGLTKCSLQMEWCIFMDADVSLKEGFLVELNAYLATHPQAGYGTTTVLLDKESWMATAWSLFNNFSFRMFKVLYTIHIVRRDIAEKISYDENLASGEDIEYGRSAVKYGPYFYMPTRSVVTSARRFEKKGYLTMFFINMYHGLAMFILPKSRLKKVEWEVIR